MNILFLILSAAYIAGIFLLADSPMVSDVSAFNPYSILHIPLYGILTLLLILSFPPSKQKCADTINSSNSSNLVVAGIIALVVAIADEIHQAYVPNRNASVIDVLLDLLGIICCILLVRHFFLASTKFHN
jgi:VanZ family protein